MRRHGKVDANQADIVKALRQAGCSVFVTSSVGDGFVDLVCGRHGKNEMLEVKDENQPPSKRRLTPKEQEFRDNWRGTIYTVESVEDALSVMGIVSYTVRD